MDNALVIDGVIVVILIAGIVFGAKRGLVKSLMGLLVGAAALVGAVLLADLLTPPVAEVAYPFVENAVIGRLAENGAEASADSRIDELLGSLEELDIDAQSVRDLLADAQGAAAEGYRAAIAEAAREMVVSIVHAALFLLLYIALLIGLKLIVRAIDRVFDLPVLSTLNGVGGAVFGFAEAALLLYALVYIAPRLGVTALTEHANDTYLLPIFLDHSPVELISSITHKA